MKRTGIVTPLDIRAGLLPESNFEEATTKAASQFIWFFINKLPQHPIASFTNEQEDQAVLNPFTYFPVKQVVCRKGGNADSAVLLTNVQMCIYPEVRFEIKGKMKLRMAPPMFDRAVVAGNTIKVYFDRQNPKEEWHITL